MLDPTALHMTMIRDGVSGRMMVWMQSAHSDANVTMNWSMTVYVTVLDTTSVAEMKQAGGSLNQVQRHDEYL